MDWRKLLLTFVAFSFAGCSGGSKSAPEGPWSKPYRVVLDTSKGPVVIDVDPNLAPNGAKRFYDLVKANYFNGARFYRVVPNFVVQWGAAADPAVTQKWSTTIPDDPVKGTNTRGAVTFAATGQPNSRSTHMFINLGDNPRLDGMGFAPIGRVTSGMDHVDNIYAGYGEAPNQASIADDGNKYLEKNFPQLDYIKTAHIESAAQ
jgi:peptidyl-prolyl cis-trans isomerase A (cyclophilin A)